MRLSAGMFGIGTSVFLVSACFAADLPTFTVQGPNWNDVSRADFYSRDQGSRMVPLTWLQALKQSNGQLFLSDSLARYGYLPNPTDRNGLPVGFNATGPSGAQTVGMTCAACHTRQITADGKTYRIDGGPAIVDFQSLLSDLDTAVGQVLQSDATFAPFASSVLHSPSPDTSDVAALRGLVDAWYLRYHTLMVRALPTPAWGPARLDAVSMIFNRLAGLDLGPAPSFLIPDNIQKADAPVRYPFIWNAPIQDKTQWPTFADNGSDVLALSRNLGEVLGVFGVFQPTHLLGPIINFTNNSSANFDGLAKLEDLVKQIGPPQWPWEIDTDLANAGEEVFNRPTAQGGCQECHKIAPGAIRLSFERTWLTPQRNVGTDTREYDVLVRTVDTGVLEGGYFPRITPAPLKKNDLAFTTLALSVVGLIAEHAVTSIAPLPAVIAPVGVAAPGGGNPPSSFTRLDPALRDLEGAFHLPAPQGQQPPPIAPEAQPAPAPSSPLSPRGSYEARVLQGIWAAAPYLHNGSVPTLVELLKPAAERVSTFKVGPAYDKDNVGLATQQSQFDYSIVTTDCSDLNSGNSRCGHEYGTQLSPADKRALLEYLKKL